MSPSPLRFAHLTVQTDHSRNGSVVQIQPLVRRAAELGRHVIGIADDDVMTGVPELRQAAAQAGIRPVFGVRLAVDGGDRSDGSGATTAEESSSRRARVTLTARTDDGLRNLYRLCSLAWLRGTPQAPAVSYDQLRTHRAGIMAITGDRYSEVGRHVLAGDLAAARDTLDKLVWALGPAWTRLAICVTREGPDPVLLEALADLADRAGVATVATANVQYLRPEDERHHRAALCVATRSTLADPGAVPAPDATWLDPAIDDVAWARVRAAVMENDRLAMWCRADPLRRRSAPPRFMPEGDDQSVLLRARVATGLRERYGDPVPAAARERAEAELEVIGRRSWDAYFLIVEGIVRWAEGQGIPVGPGRGSAAGAIVNYALRITDVDPLHFDLLFERFLSPDRVSMPDIDIDFSVKGRERVMEYVTDKYGRERVAQIVTFGRMLPRNATKDSARIHGYDYATGDRLAKLIPEPIMGKTPPLEECLAEGTELRQTYDTDPVAKEVLDTARG
ncbi:MAG: PHP domain-containing protein, partial [Solirubrobacteraceae bacterium]